VKARADRLVGAAADEDARRADDVVVVEDGDELLRRVDALLEHERRVTRDAARPVHLLRAREDEGALRMALEEVDAPLEELGVPKVVVVEEPDVRRAAGLDQAAPVLGRGHGRRPHDEVHARVLETGLERRSDDVGVVAVLGDCGMPARERLREHAFQRLTRVPGTLVRRDPDVDDDLAQTVTAPR
jgi:hypothetical protein